MECPPCNAYHHITVIIFLDDNDVKMATTIEEETVRNGIMYFLLCILVRFIY